MCGVEIELTLNIADATVAAVGYRAHACALVSASASILAEVVRGRSIADIQDLAAEFAACLGDRHRSFPPGFEAIALVQLLPTRRRCALLPWDALKLAIDPRLAVLADRAVAGRLRIADAL